MGRRAAGEGKPWTREVARPLAVGAAVAIFVATAWPPGWPPRLSGGGDLVLELGRGGLSEWRAILEAPASWTSILMLANVGVYLPFGLLGVLAWPGHKWRVLAAGLVISLAVETAQFTVSERVAATDDVLLNGIGLVVGWLGGLALARLLRRSGLHRRADEGQAASDHGLATPP